MTTASVSILKARLSEYLARVKRGEEVAVTDRGRQIARIVPPSAVPADLDAGIAELVRLGIAKPGRKGGISLDFLKRQRPKDPRGLVLKALLEDREQGR